MTGRSSQPAKEQSGRDFNPLAPAGLRDLSLYSAFLFIMAALLAQFLLTLWTALLLKISSISFDYGVFSVRFLSETASGSARLMAAEPTVVRWSEEQIYLVFGTGPLLLTALGLRVLYSLKRRTAADWRTKLALSWVAFVMLNALPCNLLAGIFFYDGFGTAFQWIASGYLARGLTGLGVLLLLVGSGRFWRRLFLNACSHPAFLEDEYLQKRFVDRAFVRSWVFGMAVLSAFSLPHGGYSWWFALACLGIPAVTYTLLRFQAITITGDTGPVFRSNRLRLALLACLILLWAAGFIRIGF